jgi:hypothetical protein
MSLTVWQLIESNLMIGGITALLILYAIALARKEERETAVAAHGAKRRSSAA